MPYTPKKKKQPWCKVCDGSGAVIYGASRVKTSCGACKGTGKRRGKR